MRKRIDMPTHFAPLGYRLSKLRGSAWLEAAYGQKYSVYKMKWSHQDD